MHEKLWGHQLNINLVFFVTPSVSTDADVTDIHTVIVNSTVQWDVNWKTRTVHPYVSALQIKKHDLFLLYPDTDIIITPQPHQPSFLLLMRVNITNGRTYCTWFDHEWTEYHCFQGHSVIPHDVVCDCISQIGQALVKERQNCRTESLKCTDNLISNLINGSYSLGWVVPTSNKSTMDKNIKMAVLFTYPSCHFYCFFSFPTIGMCSWMRIPKVRHREG